MNINGRRRKIKKLKNFWWENDNGKKIIDPSIACAILKSSHMQKHAIMFPIVYAPLCKSEEETNQSSNCQGKADTKHCSHYTKLKMKCEKNLGNASIWDWDMDLEAWLTMHFLEAYGPPNHTELKLKHKWHTFTLIREKYIYTNEYKYRLDQFILIQIKYRICQGLIQIR